MQLGHGIRSGATSLVQLSSSLSLTGTTRAVPHIESIHNSKHNTHDTLACLHTRTHARTRITSAGFHALVRLCYGH